MTGFHSLNIAKALVKLRIMNDTKQIILYLRVLCGCTVLFVIANVFFAITLLRKIERVTAVAENLNQKVNELAAATAPLGHAAVDKAVKVTETIDANELGKRATEGIKDLGGAAKEKAKQWLNKDNSKAP